MPIAGSAGGAQRCEGLRDRIVKLCRRNDAGRGIVTPNDQDLPVAQQGRGVAGAGGVQRIGERSKGLCYRVIKFRRL